MPEFTTERKSIKQYEMQPLDAIRLDRIFKLETKDMTKKAQEQGVVTNNHPNLIMAKALDAEVQGRKFRFEGIKTKEVVSSSGAAGSKKNKNDNNKGGNKGAQAQP